MIPPEAIQRFTEQQRQLVHDSYDQAWQQGVLSYMPDENPDQPSPAHQHAGEEASLTGVSLLAARTRRAYVPPEAPDMARRQRALAAALKSTERMGVELATLSPTPEHHARAQAETDAGRLPVELATAAALGYAVAEWAETNSNRLDLGASVAWAGEQAGYAEAASTDGQLLEWDDQGDDHECEDCLGFAGLGPLPLEEFPTTPGAGDTECSMGCRCALKAVPLEWLEYGSTPRPLPGLTVEDQAVIDKVSGQAQERLDRLMPSFA